MSNFEGVMKGRVEDYKNMKVAFRGRQHKISLPH